MVPPVIVEHVRGDFAQGYVLMNTISFEPCYIAKNGDYFAYGKTLRDANMALRETIKKDEIVRELISEFIVESPDADVQAQGNVTKKSSYRTNIFCINVHNEGWFYRRRKFDKKYQ